MILARKPAAPRQIGITEGPLLGGMLRFLLPLILTNLLQQLYHAADVMIVGLSSEPDAVGAVGSTGTYLLLISNLFIGFSVGANVVVARCIGAVDREGTARASHTSICMGLLFGVGGSLLGILFARPVLVAMGYDGYLLTLALRYCYIYLAGMPFLSMTNFLASILRAQGNSRITLYALSVSGVLNVLLNLLFVMGFDLSVEGVALATAISNAASTVWLWGYLARYGEECALHWNRLHINRREFREITRIGLPAGLQSTFFSLSNILIQSSIMQINNALTPAGSAYAPVIKGNAAAGSIEDFIFTALDAITVASSTYTAQNLGAQNCRRARRAFRYLCGISVVIALLMTFACIFWRDPLLALYGVEDGEDLLASICYDTAVAKMLWKWPAFFVYAIMNACAGTIRGLGKSTTAAMITLFGTCVLRIVWIYTGFRYFFTLEAIYVSYPVSWVITGIFFLWFTLVLFRRRIREEDARKASVS